LEGVAAVLAADVGVDLLRGLALFALLALGFQHFLFGQGDGRGGGGLGLGAGFDGGGALGGAGHAYGLEFGGAARLAVHESGVRDGGLGLELFELGLAGGGGRAETVGVSGVL
jgi:hypothetical protein